MGTVVEHYELTVTEGMRNNIIINGEEKSGFYEINGAILIRGTDGYALFEPIN